MFKASVSKVMGVVAAAAGLMMASSGALAVTTDALSPFSTLDASTTFVSGVPFTAPLAGEFTNYYSFLIADPANELSSTINFVPAGSISPFTATLYSSTSCTLGGNCTLDSTVANFATTSATEVKLDWTGVTAGYYVIEVSGNNLVGSGVAFSGQVSVREAGVPLPGTVALLGLGLSGLAAARRRKA